MSRMQQIQLTARKKSFAADASGTARVPIRRWWLLSRIAGAVFALIVSGYALIMQGIHYGDASPAFDIAAIAKEKFGEHPSVDAKQLVDDATHYSERVQNVLFHRWPLWSFGVTAFVLLLASRTLFLEFGRLQSDQPGLVASPRALTVNVDANRRALKPIPWSAIGSIELRRMQGWQGVTVRLREAGHVSYEGLFASHLPNTGRNVVWLSTLQLAANAKDLKELLDGYLAAHGNSPPSQRST